MEEEILSHKDHMISNAKRHDVIVVRINYRLGPFGWFIPANNKIKKVLINHQILEH